MMYLVTSTTILKNATDGLIIIFNVGIISRILYDLVSSMVNEEKVTKKIFNLVKAAIVVDCILGIIELLKIYYK